MQTNDVSDHTSVPIRYQPNLLAAVVFLCCAVAASALIWQQEKRRIELERANVTNHALSFARAVEIHVQKALSASYAMAALVRQGNGKINNFESVAEEMLPLYPGVAGLFLAPGGVVSHAVPLAGNEKTLGHDLLKDPKRTKEAFLARDTGKLTLAGPFDLVQGGMGAAGRFPVFLDETNQKSSFWGFTAVLLRFPEVLEPAQLSRLAEQDLAYELSRIHPDTGKKQVIDNSSPSPLIDPVTVELEVPNSRWTLSVASIQGWSNPSRLLASSALGLVFACLMGFLAKMWIDTQNEIIQRKRVEEDLKESEGKYRALFTELNSGFGLNEVICDQAGVPCDYRFIAINRVFESMIGMPAEQVVGKTVLEIMPSMSRSRIERYGKVAITGDSDEFEDYSPLMNRHLEIRLYSPKRGQFAVIFHDISERKRVEKALLDLNDSLEGRIVERTQQLNIAREAAETASRAKSTFLANMSHEIRTPMNAILGMAHILRRSGLTPSQTGRLDKIDIATNHLLGIINNILDISTIEAGKFVLENTSVSIDRLLGNAHSILAEHAQAKQLALHVENESFPTNLTGDPTRLQQALLNYAINAIKFTEQGSVTLRALKQDESAESVVVRFEVRDTGTGISSETVPRLFNAFEQADNSANRRYGGTGLGLSITKRLAEMMGGEVGVESLPEVGSTFWFTARLKKKTDKNEIASPVDNSEAEQLIGHRHLGRPILLVDDESVNLEIAKLFLEDSGLVVDTAEDGEQAVRMAKKETYALILMDMQMPHLNGVEATRQIRELPMHRNTPILAMTANTFAEDRVRCFEAGMNDFISKPFNPDKLFSTLLKWLDRRAD